MNLHELIKKKRKAYLTMHHQNNFIAFSDEAMKLMNLEKGNYPIVLIYKRNISEHKHEWAIKRVKPQVGLSTVGAMVLFNKLTKEVVIENLNPTNQRIFYDMGFGVDKDIRVDLKKIVTEKGGTEFLFRNYREV